MRSALSTPSPAFLLFCAAVSCFGLVGASGAASGPEHELTLVLQSGEPRVTQDGDRHRIDMDGFAGRPRPGEPALPSRRFLIALPPGARVVSVESRELGAVSLPGAYRIVPTAPLLPIGGPHDASGEAERIRIETRRTEATAYATDDGFPARLVRLAGAGALRKYAYACVSFCPFRYRARSGELVHYAAAEVTVRYRLPSPGSAEAREADLLRGDTVADARASRLFVNWAQMQAEYEPGDQFPGPRQLHDYVIICHPSAAGAISASAFPAWKTSLGYSVRTVLTTDPEIAGQPGGLTTRKIRNFLRAYYAVWGIEYVLLVGGSSVVPMRYCYPKPDDHTHDPGNAGNPGGSVPTDAYYADLSLPESQSWDSDGDGYLGEWGEDTPDFLAEVIVGRIPTNDAARITYTLDKLVTFEQDTGPWKGRALHGGAMLFYENQDYGGVPRIDGARVLAEIETDVMPGWTLSHSCEAAGLDPSTYGWPALTLDAFTSDWRNNQYGVVNWSGHGSAAGAYRMIWTWDDGDGVFETDGSDGYAWDPIVYTGASLEDDHPSIVFAVSCSVGYPESNAYGNVGIDLLTLPGFGASAGVLCSTRSAHITAYWPADPGGAESFCYEFNRFLIDGPAGPERVGDALYDAKHYCHVTFPRDHYSEFKNLYNYNLYGDPSMVMNGGSAVDVAYADRGAARPTIQSQPNPFGASTTIRYAIPETGPVALRLFDVSGRLVTVLEDPVVRDAGPHALRWDGRDSRGRAVTPGVYFCRLEAGRRSATARLVILR